MTQYRCILADPPWPEHGSGKCKRGADKHYRLLKVRKIYEVMRSAPCWEPDQTGCHFWLWSTSNHLAAAVTLIDQLGFRYVSSAVWIKPYAGLGRYMRHRHELLLFASIGKAMIPPPERRGHSVIESPRRGHSQKPAIAYGLIESISPGPRLEMFARSRREGWDAWGDEVDRIPEKGREFTALSQQVKG